MLLFVRRPYQSVLGLSVLQLFFDALDICVTRQRERHSSWKRSCHHLLTNVHSSQYRLHRSSTSSSRHFELPLLWPKDRHLNSVETITKTSKSSHQRMKLNSLGGSVVFTRCRQCAPLPSTPQSASALYRFCPLLSCFEYINTGNVLGWPLSPSILPFTRLRSRPSTNDRPNNNA